MTRQPRCAAANRCCARLDRAFAKTRDRLNLPVLTSRNGLVVRRADEAGLVGRWCGLRLVAAEASLSMRAVRTCLRSRSAAQPDQGLSARLGSEPAGPGHRRNRQSPGRQHHRADVGGRSPTRRPSRRSRNCNRALVDDLRQRVLPRLLRLIDDVAAAITQAKQGLAATLQRFVQGRSQPSLARHLKLHPSCTCKA